MFMEGEDGDGQKVCFREGSNKFEDYDHGHFQEKRNVLSSCGMQLNMLFYCLLDRIMGIACFPSTFFSKWN
ncbi:hypothetical protein A7K69_12080 [Parageobacillus thermoglucosidasius]|jgi:hypothetical protein|uniref:Uncharacterized protein n=1 Tax=Parageobacillus thermoglucosidasius TaxID=1426 RepID=A0A1B7KPU9_PARTM|nr:hypothetical protein A7K69_12080 [Parageobacillus thermoglucosidasius]